MALNARTATAKDFDNAAQQNANAAWFWLVIAALICYFFGWWSLIPSALGALSVMQSVSATLNAGRLRDGTYKIPNLNNGVRDDE